MESPTPASRAIVQQASFTTSASASSTTLSSSLGGGPPSHHQPARRARVRASKRSVMAGLTAAGTLLVFLASSSPSPPAPSSSSPSSPPPGSGEPRKPPLHHTRLTTEQLHELAVLLAEKMSTAPTTTCVAKLVGLVEGFDKLATSARSLGGGTRARTPHLTHVTPSCSQLDLHQQQAALSHISLVLRYHASIGASNATLVVALACVLVGGLLPCVAWAWHRKAAALQGAHSGKATHSQAQAQAQVQRCGCPVCAGKCVLGREVGSGGFASAHLARVHQRDMVAKMISVNMALDINQAQAALDEAKRLIRFSHPHVVHYHDVFLHRVVTTHVQDFVCILMEYCNGGTLQDLHLSRALTTHELLQCLHQTSSGFAYIHKHRYIHRDIKPENVFVRREQGKLAFKIGDFGLAWACHEAGRGVSPGAYGTTAFMSPECFAKQWFDSSSDVWSLGVTMLELILGENHAQPLVDAGVCPAHKRSSQSHSSNEDHHPVPPQGHEHEEEDEGEEEGEEEEEEELPSLCELALADPASWPHNLALLKHAITDRLLAQYNAEYYALSAARPDDDDDVVDAHAMRYADAAVDCLPSLIADMLALDPAHRPSMLEVKRTVHAAMR